MGFGVFAAKVDVAAQSCVTKLKRYTMWLFR